MITLEELLDGTNKIIENKKHSENFNEIYSLFHKKHKEFYQVQSLFHEIGILWLCTTDEVVSIILDRLFYSLKINKNQMKLMLGNCTPYSEWIANFDVQDEIREILIHTTIIPEMSEP